MVLLAMDVPAARMVIVLINPINVKEGNYPTLYNKKALEKSFNWLT